MTGNQLGYHAKPCGLLNVNGYYEQLTAFLDNVMQQGFLVQEHRNMVLASHSPAQLLDSFTDYRAPEVEK